MNENDSLPQLQTHYQENHTKIADKLALLQKVYLNIFTKFEGICDTLLLGSTTPTEREEVITRFSFLQKKVNGEVPTGGVGAAIIADINKQVKEDIPVWENKKYAAKPVLCDSDGPIAKFRKHFATFYAENDDAKSIETVNINK